MTPTEQALQEFITRHESLVVELSREAADTYYKANASGKKEDYEKSAGLSLKLNKIYADPQSFAMLKEFGERPGQVNDPLLKRQLELLYNAYLGNQINEQDLEKIVRLESEVENKYSTFRAEVNGKKMSDNQLNEILRKSKNSQELEAAWLGTRQIAHVVAEDVLKLVRLRNDAAKKLGFSNYHEMSLKLNEQDPGEIEGLFDELDKLTSDIFSKVKHEIDNSLAKQYGVQPGDLMPWHYQDRFFQQVPEIFEMDMDSFFKGKDVVALTRDYYQGIGLPIQDLISNSDLFERDGKYQHAYCMDVDRKGDIRVMASVKDDEYWMGTLLHEFGHAAYDKYIDQSLPWNLRSINHIFATEAVAMLFGRMTYSPAWLMDAAGVQKEQANKIAENSAKSLRYNELVFTRWAQVVYRFEKSMYEDPGQDLNSLWYTLVEKYQSLKSPENRNQPDWAAKIHLAISPAYYHNYVLGSIFASQIKHVLDTQVLKSAAYGDHSFAGNQEIGRYFIEKIFKAGRSCDWRELVRNSTGSALTPKFFSEQILSATE